MLSHPAYRTDRDAEPGGQLIGLVLVEVEGVGHEADGVLEGEPLVAQQLPEARLGRGDGHRAPGQHPVYVEADAKVWLQTEIRTKVG